ncbi:MAG: prolyl oligopeptidase family serine peptidase [Gemmatimonadaceae bacterium]
MGVARGLTVTLWLGFAAGCTSSAGQNGAPPSRTDTTTAVYHGIRVQDPYRWLEDGSSAEVRQWVEAQNGHTDSILSAWGTDSALTQRVGELARTSPDRQSPSIVGSTLFYLRNSPPAPQPVLVSQPWPEGSPRVLVDVNDAGGSVAITGYWPSPSGAYVAYTTAMGGNELATLRFVDVRRGVVLPDSLPFAGGGTSGPTVAWDHDERGVSFARFKLPAPGQGVQEFDVSIQHHVLGVPNDATTEVGEGLSRIVMWALSSSAGGRTTAAMAYIGDGSFAEVYVRDGGSWRKAVSADAGVTTGTFVGDQLMVIATEGSPRGRIAAVSADGTLRTIVPEGDWAAQSITPTSGGLLVMRSLGMRTRVDHYRLDGTLVRTISLPDSGVAIGTIASSATSTDALVTYSGWTRPTRWVRYDGKTGATNVIFDVKASGDYSGIAVDMMEATSADGTKVPVAVVTRKGQPKDGTAPTILTGYGGFRNVYGPRFIGTSLAWIERGGALAYADIRGGSSFGEGWHLGGMRTQKQHSFDDFFAAAQELVRQKYTTPSRLGITGGSNGGLLVGAAMTQHPEAYRAVVSFVGIYDMLRHETFANGAYNTREYGATSDSVEFLALYGYSPLHHVVDGTKYPSILMETGLNDPRVASWQSRKFTAALQNASAGGPVLLLTRSDAGHGIGAPFSQRVGNAAMALSFFSHELGLARPKRGS